MNEYTRLGDEIVFESDGHYCCIEPDSDGGVPWYVVYSRADSEYEPVATQRVNHERGLSGLCSHVIDRERYGW